MRRTHSCLNVIIFLISFSQLFIRKLIKQFLDLVNYNTYDKKIKIEKQEMFERKPIFGMFILLAGAEGVFIDSQHKSSPNGNIEGLNYSTLAYDKCYEKMPVTLRHTLIGNFSPPSSLPSSIHHQVTNIIQDDNQRKYGIPFERQLIPRSPTNEYEVRRNPMKNPLQAHPQMSYHNMFTPSTEPGTLWRCRSCGKEVTNRWHHFHSHTAQRSLCPYCPATYSRIDTLRSHLKQKHRNEQHMHKGSPS